MQSGVRSAASLAVGLPRLNSQVAEFFRQICHSGKNRENARHLLAFPLMERYIGLLIFPQHSSVRWFKEPHEFVMNLENQAMPPGDVTQLLERVNDGDRSAMNELLPLIYEELHALAASYLHRERVDHTLQPTALVNEAYLKMVDQTRAKWESRGHFLAIAATAMRRILVNHARDRQRQKRGGGVKPVELDENIVAAAKGDLDLIALDEALKKLASFDEQKVRIVEHRFFAGMTIKDTAEALGQSVSTVNREWDFARTWLLREISRT